MYNALKYGGSLEVGAEVADGVQHQMVEDALISEIDQLKAEPVGDRELQRVKNQNLADSYRRLQSELLPPGCNCSSTTCGRTGVPQRVDRRIEAVTAEDVQRVANTYFTDTGRNVLWYFRKEGSEEDPELAALSGQAKAMAKQALAQINMVEDPAQLEQGLAQMQGHEEPRCRPSSSRRSNW